MSGQAMEVMQYCYKNLLGLVADVWYMDYRGTRVGEVMNWEVVTVI